MDNTREKLIELLESAESAIYWNSSDKGFIEKIADHLISHGVTFATDNNVGDKMDFCGELCLFAEGLIKKAREPKWIPVTERLPEEDGKYLVFEQSGGRTVTSVLRFAKDARKVDRYDFKGRWKNAWYEYDSEWGHYTVDSVTHWMPLPSTDGLEWQKE